MRACFSIITNNANSILGNKLAYFRDRFAININRCTLNDNIKKIKLSTVISDEEQLIINNIWSLILVKSNQYYVEGFDGSEIGDILTFLATSCCCYRPTPPACSCGGVRQPSFSREALPGVSST